MSYNLSFEKKKSRQFKIMAGGNAAAKTKISHFSNAPTL